MTEAEDPCPSPPLRVGFLSAAQGLLPMVLSRWREALDCPVHLTRADTAVQLDMLRSEQLEIGFLRPPARRGILSLVTVRREGMIAVLPATHWLASRQKLRLADLCGERWVRHRAVIPTSFQSRMEELIRRRGIAIRNGVEADDTPSVMMLAAAGYGVALLPETVSLFSPPGTVCRTISDIRPFVRLAIARRRNERHPLIAKAVCIAVEAALGLPHCL